MQTDQDPILTRIPNLKDVNAQQPVLKGWWNLKEGSKTAAADLSNNDHALHAGKPSPADSIQCLGTTKLVLRTDQSYSVAAWVRLDNSLLNGKLALKPNEHAFTAVSQDSPTHSGFYLGARWTTETKDGKTTAALKWNFTVSPIDGSETGPLEWAHAHATSELDDSVLDQWVMLVGVCDVETRTAHLYVPGNDETGIARMPKEWTFWRADDGFQVGRGRWLGRDVDFWPGQVGIVRAFSGVLTAEDAKKLYREDTKLMSA